MRNYRTPKEERAKAGILAKAAGKQAQSEVEGI
jgi:hypothetical protein